MTTRGGRKRQADAPADAPPSPLVVLQPAPPAVARRLAEYPPRRDARGFALHHWRLFTGYTTAAICGADRYTPAAKVFREWRADFEEAVAAAADRNARHVPAIADGHHWEAAIVRVAARHLYKAAFLERTLCVRESGPVQDPSDPHARATCDALLCRADGSLLWPPVAIEAKFSTRHLPARPSVAHLFQLHHQMHTLRVRSCFIAYGHSLGATEARDWTDGHGLVVRVFHVLFSDALWAWVCDRRAEFLHAFRHATDVTAPSLAALFEAAWLEGDEAAAAGVPPEPAWRAIVEPHPYSAAMIAALPARLPAQSNMPEPVAASTLLAEA